MKENSRLLWIGMVSGLMCFSVAGKMMGSAADDLSAQVDSLADAVTARVTNHSDREKLLRVTTNIKTVLIPVLSAAQEAGDIDAGAVFTVALRIIGTNDIAATLNDYASAQALISAFADVWGKVVQSSPTLIAAATLYYYFAYVSAELFALLTPPAVVPSVVAAAPKTKALLSNMAIAGIAVASLVAVAGVGALIYYLRRVRPRTKVEAENVENKGIRPTSVAKNADLGLVVVVGEASIGAIEKPKNRIGELSLVAVTNGRIDVVQPRTPPVEEVSVVEVSVVAGADQMARPRTPRVRQQQRPAAVRPLTVDEAERSPTRFVTLGTIPPGPRVGASVLVPPLPGSPESSGPPSLASSPTQNPVCSDADEIPAITVGQAAMAPTRTASVVNIHPGQVSSVVDPSIGAAGLTAGSLVSQVARY